MAFWRVLLALWRSKYTALDAHRDVLMNDGSQFRRTGKDASASALCGDVAKDALDQLASYGAFIGKWVEDHGGRVGVVTPERIDHGVRR